MRFLALAIMAAACSTDAPPRAATPHLPPLVGIFRAETHQISRAEHVVVLDIPDRGLPRRCVVFVNEATHTTVLNCGLDGPGMQ